MLKCCSKRIVKGVQWSPVLNCIQRKFNQNTYVFFQENTFENIIPKIMHISPSVHEFIEWNYSIYAPQQQIHLKIWVISICGLVTRYAALKNTHMYIHAYIHTAIHTHYIHIQMILVWMYIEGILPKGPYLPCVSMAGRAFWQDTLDMHKVQKKEKNNRMVLT